MARGFLCLQPLWEALPKPPPGACLQQLLGEVAKAAPVPGFGVQDSGDGAAGSAG